MLHIGICDDVREDRERIKEFVLHATFSYDDVEFKLFTTGQEVIEQIEEQDFCCDLLFMDINMPEKNGIETAKYIREQQIDVDIIFITVSTEHVFDGYVYRAFSYLLKPLDRKRLQDEINRYLSERYASSNCLHVTIHNRKEQIYLNNVFYFEGKGRKIICHQRGEEQEFYAKMGDLEQMLLQYQFIRCHQSYLVNKKYIKNVTRTDVVLEDETLPISRKYLDTVREHMNEDKGGV